MPYATITSEGGLLPAEILDDAAAGHLPGQRPEDFGLSSAAALADDISRVWQLAKIQWQRFQARRADLRPDESPTTLTRELWVLPLLRSLEYAPVRNPSAYLVQNRSFALSHRADEREDAFPIHIESPEQNLDMRAPSGRPRVSPHALMQEYLNATEQLWGMVTNGDRLRLLRDSSRFTRPIYLEFDLRAMLERDQFREFALLYRLLHRSRLPRSSDAAADCLLEQYQQQAFHVGGRVRDGLRTGVEQALAHLGSGLLRHPANGALRDQLARGLATGSDGAGSLTPLGFYRHLLRLVYRLLFLMVAEERKLIAPDADPTDPFAPEAYRPAPERRLAIYQDYYSLSRLRRLAERSGVGKGGFSDLWQGLLTTFFLLEGSDPLAPARLGLAPLDGDLFGPEACGPLTAQTRLLNADLLAAVRALSLYYDREAQLTRRVNYAALDVEELGSVYESLLDYRPLVQLDGQPRFELARGTERKTTGSYYTRPELVQELIQSALVPVLDARLRAARTPEERAQAILALRVVDPACGSGAFLLAAARRMGRELARVRAGEDQPSPSKFREAVRDVIRQTIFGVDLNPLAVDLCKLSLWIEGHAAGRPLSFLDHHIRWGNSLVGASRALVADGIPDEAYQAVSGDERATATSIKRRNKQERELYKKQGLVQRDLFTDGSVAGETLATGLRALDATPDDSVAAVRARAARYATLRAEHATEWVAFDLWTAAFFQPLTAANAPYVPTSRDLIELQPSGPKAILAAALAAQVGFFHWELEFAQVFEEQGGFDLVLGNPPWERIKLQEQEHFADVPEIAAAANRAARVRAIAAWRNGSEHQRARIAQYDQALQRAEAESRFVRGSGRFKLTAVGDVNTYALFAEQMRTLRAATGRVGVIVPTGIATDDSTKAFFGAVSQGELVSLYDFENREGLFPDVDSRYKFSLVTLGAGGGGARFVFFAGNVGQLQEEPRRFTLTAEEIGLINPNTRTAPLFRTQADAELTKAIYRRVPVLIHEASGANPWGVRFATMFHMSNDSHLFATEPGPGLLPLYEAKLLHQYTHRWASYQGTATHDLSASTLADPHATVTPRYWVAQAAVEERLAGRWERGWLLGFRDITNATNERTAIFSLLPRTAVGHTMPLVFFAQANPAQVACFLATINSFVFDYVTRQKVGGTHLTYTYVNQLPVLPPERFTADAIAYIVPRVVELVYTAWDMGAFAADIWAEADTALRAELLERNAACNAGAPAELFSPRDGFPLPPYRWNEERRALARAELDACIARLYGLTRDELRYILDPKEVYGPDFPGETFRVLKDNETKRYGEYRTRRLVLERF